MVVFIDLRTDINSILLRFCITLKTTRTIFDCTMVGRPLRPIRKCSECRIMQNQTTVNYGEERQKKK